MTNINGSVCLNHPDVPASFRCATCGKPICSQCAIKSGGFTYCSMECKADAIRTGAMVENIQQSKNRGNSKRFVTKLLWIIIVILVGVVAYYFYNQNKATIDSKINQGIQTINNKKQDIGNNIIHDSKFKTAREKMIEQ